MTARASALRPGRRPVAGRLRLAGLALGALAALGATWALLRPAEPVIGGPFELIDATGAPVTDRDFRGRYRIMYFGYTFCPDVCPTALANLAAALDALSEAERAQIAAMFVSVDPDRDHGADLEDYAQAFHPLIHGYTGSREQIDAAAARYRVTYAFAPADESGAYAVDHSSIIYVHGPDGAYVTHFTHRSTLGKMVEALSAAIPG